MFQTDSPPPAPSPATQAAAEFSLPPHPDEITAPDFIPVPMARIRRDGWTAPRQVAFLRALAVTGSVATAAKMVGISRKSAYQLRARAEAESFAAAWDIAIDEGRARVFDAMMERALNGVTTLTLRLGGAIEIGHGPDRQLMAAHLKAPLPHNKPRPAHTP